MIRCSILVFQLWSQVPTRAYCIYLFRDLYPNSSCFFQSVWGSNSNSSINEKFSAIVTAAYNGITTGGKVDESIMKDGQSKTFSDSMHRNVSIVGGDVKLNTMLAANSTQKERFTDWSNTATTGLVLTSFVVVELWSLMKDSAEKELNDLSNTVQEAFEYIVTHPQPYKTLVSFDIQSDCKFIFKIVITPLTFDVAGTDFCLLNPSAIIMKDPDNH